MSYRYVDSDAALAATIQAALTAPVYAIDTEFHREHTYFAQLALVQLAWEDQVVLIDPLAVSVEPLRELLESDAVCVVHAASQDLEILQRECGTGPARLFDPQVAASFLGFGTASLGRLTEAFLDIKLKKGAQLSDWTRRPLGDRELEYAASDVLYLVELYDTLCQTLDGRGRLAWCEEECERVRRVDRQPPPPERAWWKLKGKARFKGKSAAIIQEVAAWRLNAAIERDIPIRRVLPDVAMLAIAERAPKDHKALGRVRGLNGRSLKGRVGDEIMAAIERGRAMDHGDIQYPPSRDTRAPEALTALCLAWASQRSTDDEIDQRLLGTRDEIKSYLVDPTDSPLASGWRHELLGADLDRIKAGEVLLGVDDGGGRLVLHAT